MRDKAEYGVSQTIIFDFDDFKINVGKKKSDGFERAFHEQIEIKYFYEGNCAILIDDTVHIAERGSIAVVNPFEIHTNVDTERYHGRYYLLIVDLDFLSEHAPRGLDLRSILVSERKKIKGYISSDSRIANIIMRVYEEMQEKKEHYRLVVYNLVSELFALLLRSYLDENKSGNASEERGKRAELIAPALSLIFEKYAGKITLDELAAAAKVSKYHFIRAFKEEMGVTPMEYVIKHRISIAEALLCSGNASIAEVAVRCGFEDASYFYRCYKKIKGYSYRRKEKSNIFHKDSNIDY